MATITRGTDFFDKTHDRSLRHGLYTGPVLYAAGGESLPPEQLALGRIDRLIFDCASNGTDLRLVVYDYTNKKVKWFDLAGAELGAVNLSAYSARFTAIGK